MINSIAPEVRDALREGEVGTTLREHFAPLQVQPMNDREGRIDNCSTDGIYETSMTDTPTILYADDVAPARARFTLLHELGHHLLATQFTGLLDSIDDLAGDRTSPAQVEERVCHEFASRVLVPDQLISAVVSSTGLHPRDLLELYSQCSASWEALAVRLAAASTTKVAIVLMREPGCVGFSAASGHLDSPWWPRGSQVQPGGPLNRALTLDQRARSEIYRYGLAYSARLFCDSVKVDNGLSVAVLSGTPSDGHFEILEDPAPLWVAREVFCEQCNEERTEGWCDTCRGRHCPECGRCACSKPAANPVCPGCGLMSPKRVGATYCRTCEADLLA